MIAPDEVGGNARAGKLLMMIALLSASASA